MKRWIYSLFLILSVVQADATITFTSRGTTNSAAASTTIGVVIASTVAAGHFGVMIYSCDNAGTNGDTKIFTQATFTDSVGNTWTRQLDTIYDPGAANAGVEVACYTAPIITQITTSDTVVTTLSTSAGGRTSRIWDATGATGPYVVTSGSVSDLLTSGQTGTAVSMTTGSIPNGDGIIAWCGSENSSGSTTGDSDTTNGSWGAQTSITAAAAPMRLDSQYKVVTGTGTQSYDITLGASADWQSAWIQLSETNPSPPVNSATNGFLIWY